METPHDPAVSREAHREARLVRLERMTELPLMLLAFAMVPLLTASFLWDISPSTESVLVALDVLIWALFAVDLITKTAIAPRRATYLRQHWLDVVIVLIPLARPLRLLRVVAYGARAYRGAMQLVRIDFLVTYAIGLILLIATVVTSVERGHNPKLDTFPDALWWSIVTVTTVGYGDVVPVTEIGRALAFVLMIAGIGLFGGLTANFASMLMRQGGAESTAIAALTAEVRAMREELAVRSGRQIAD